MNPKKIGLMFSILLSSSLVYATEVSLVLLRHGESEFNAQKRFAGWSDTPLTQKGIEQAKQAGQALNNAHIELSAVHTSALQRATDTAWYAQQAMQSSLPRQAYWQLNERHYGSLEGKTHSEVADVVGEEQVKIWRKSYDVPPPPLAITDSRSPTQDSRYNNIDRSVLPVGESLKQVVERISPYWNYSLKPILASGKNVMVVAHSNSLKALSANIDPNLSPKDITSLEIPNATPVVYKFKVNDDGTLSIISRQVLGETTH
ncbi:2,3-bisphosphoglycerate-dependent phosphoglycerate mutase [Moraxella oblonga]|uniref:2,3-bisphosphoglycerate-dependent phosphoglycerate mutase n=1 Tax=Moraxella oblonga TaxID=200413 RepID=UPI00082D41E3|nr:2,3-bisphosphoglycerate-dependent phosphoglycerate mutase [Moraxella oblonga]